MYYSYKYISELCLVSCRPVRIKICPKDISLLRICIYNMYEYISIYMYLVYIFSNKVFFHTNESTTYDTIRFCFFSTFYPNLIRHIPSFLNFGNNNFTSFFFLSFSANNIFAIYYYYTFHGSSVALKIYENTKNSFGTFLKITKIT